MIALTSLDTTLPPARSTARQRAFTLIEITVAVLVLATAMVTFIGVSSGALNNAWRDRNRLQATLMCRRILASIESEDVSVEIQDTEKSLLEIYRDFAAEDQMDRDDQLLQLAENFRGRLTVSYQGIPNVDPQALKRISLVAAWGESELDRVEIVYFVPGENTEDDSSGAGNGGS